jgi:hypothetical protein
MPTKHLLSMTIALVRGLRERALEGLSSNTAGKMWNGISQEYASKKIGDQMRDFHSSFLYS